MKYRVSHHTGYHYTEQVSLSHNLVRLRPREHAGQTCLWHKMTISPAPNMRSDRMDYFANHVAYFSIEEPHRQLTIESHSEVEVGAVPEDCILLPMPWEQARQALLDAADQESLLAREFSFDSPYVARSPEMKAYALPSFEAGRPLLQSVLELTERIHEDFEFLPGSTTVGTPVLDVLENRRGVCQDFAHIEIGCLRSMGLAARYVSGYLATTPPPGQERLVGADASHAWLSVFSPECGWVDFDPTNGLMPSTGHVTLAWARDYDDLGPIRGVLVGGRRQQLDVAVDVLPLEIEAT
jgi:transglutaminase-like putative cysteine protease